LPTVKSWLKIFNFRAEMITKIDLYKQSLHSDDHMEIATPVNYNPKSQRILVSVNNKVAEADYNPQTKNVTAKLVVPQNNAYHPLAAQLPKNADMRVKVFVYDFLKDKILGAKLQEFTYNTPTLGYKPSDELLSTSPVIIGNWDKRGLVEKAKNDEKIDFTISFSLNKDYTTFVPLGIKDFNGNYEPYYFAFNYSLKISNIDELDFRIYDENDSLLYSINYLKPIDILAKASPKKIKFNNTKEDSNLIVPNNPIPILEKGFTEEGNYILYWEGFDNDAIFDSSKFNNKKFKAKIIATKGNIKKSREVSFSTVYSEVDWVDVKINKKTKKIDTTLRVNLKDGGDYGLNCITYTEDEKTVNGEPNPFYGTTVKICPWDKIPSASLNPKQPIIKEITKSFEELKRLSLQGIKYHWSKHLKSINYNFNVNPINSEANCLNELILIFNTNETWGRSGNPGVLGRIYYNVGYLNFLNWYEPALLVDKWGYLDTEKNKVIEDFKYTSAHELGHSILSAYGGKYYSFTHDDSSTLLQDPNGKKNYEKEKKEGEINLMHYFKIEPSQSKYDYDIIKASEKDVFGLIWLTKLQIHEKN